jgi:hypothetical protein
MPESLFISASAEAQIQPQEANSALAVRLLTQVSTRILHARNCELSGLSITTLDMVREVLLNCGGVLNVGFDESSTERLCVDAMQALASRRRLLRCDLLMERGTLDLTQTIAAPVSESLALEIHSGLHYLGMPRTNSLNIGLYASESKQDVPGLLGLLTVSHFDLHALVPKFVAKCDVATSAVVSRIIVLPGAPKNTASRLLGESRKWLRRHRRDIRCLYTYNNPNLAFCGTIYRAANWKFIGTEPKLPDYKLDGRYISRRELTKLTGKAAETAFADYFGDRLSAVPVSQLPLEIYRLEVRLKH